MSDSPFLETGIRPATRVAVIAGGAAGNRTVTGIKTRDKLAYVLMLPEDIALIQELFDDHATFKTAVDSLKTLADESKADYNLLRGNFVNCCLAKAGLAEGTNANTLKTTNSVDYAIGGALHTKAGTDNIAMTAAAQQAVSTYCLYLVSAVANGDVTVTKGAESAADDAVLPALPASSAPIGYFKVVTDGATTFTSGTDDLSKAGLTVTYVDLLYVNSGVSASTAVTAADASAGPATLTASKPTQSAIATDLTSEFSVTADNTINNTGGTASTGAKLLVIYYVAEVTN